MGSLSRAALDLHIAQSALSQHVAALEADTRAELLHRTPRGVQPTDAGRTLYRHAQLMLQQEAEARAAVAEATGAPAGELAFGLPLSLARALGMPVFLAVRQAWPGIRLRMQEELSGTVLEWLKNGRLSLGIAFDDGNLEGLQTVPLLEERLFLVVAPDSPHARRKVVPVRELAELGLVLPSAGQGVRSRVDKALADAGLGRARVVAEVDSHTMMKQSVRCGIGPTILSWTSVEPEVERGELVAVEITRAPITRVAHVCMLPAALRSRVNQCVLEQLLLSVREAVRRPSWRGVRWLEAKPAA